MAFYRYWQNNSGGYDIGPSVVFIEANSEEEADEIAVTHDDSPIYFAGVLRGRDCECCGDRWSSAYWGEVYADDSELPDADEDCLIIRKAESCD